MIQKKVPMRRCIGCMESKPKKDLIRIIADEGALRLDLSGKANGRGAYLCADPKCLAKAVKKNSFQRNLELSPDAETVKRFSEELERIAQSRNAE
ncbi:MAG: YlxR family protein [Firmicutes bacterium]|nr:YlxR family protein [Bacillota bacterium]